jgi:hypothetical protein
MKALKTLLPAVALAAGLAVAASANATIFIGVSVNGGAIQTVAVDPTNTAAGVVNFSLGSFTINNISAIGPVLPLDLLSSNSLNTSSTTAGFLDVFITETNVAANLVHGGFISSLTSNTLPAGWSVTESTFWNAANTSAYGAGALLASHTFGNIGTSVIGTLVQPSANFALTEQYHIVATGSGTANSTIDLSSVPEPATWGLMILGFGGIGAMVRNRRRQAVFA